MLNRFRNFKRDSKGAALLEFTIVLPILLAIGLGVFEFGNALYNYQLIANGVRDAARYAAGLRATNPCSSPFFSNAVKDDIKSIAMKGVITGGSWRVPWWTDPATVVVDDTHCKPNPGNALYNYSGDVPIVTVTASVPYQQLDFWDTSASVHRRLLFRIKKGS